MKNMQSLVVGKKDGYENAVIKPKKIKLGKMILDSNMVIVAKFPGEFDLGLGGQMLEVGV